MGTWATLVVASLGLAGCLGPGSPQVGGRFDPAALVDVAGVDAIRSLDAPPYEGVEAAARWLAPSSPVVVLEGGGAARAFPLGILMRHEVVNDTLGDEPVVIAYCPLCGSFSVYTRVADGRTLTFGVSGKLYRSDVVLYDHRTRSLWPSMTGEAVRGDLRGATLERRPAAVVDFAAFAATFPDGQVLERPGPGSYDVNPYVGYADSNGPGPDLFRASPDPRLDPMERIVGVRLGGEARAYVVSAVRARGVVLDRLGGRDIVVLWAAGATSALDAPLISEGAMVGSVGVFESGRHRLERRGDAIVDRQGTGWSVLGRRFDGGDGMLTPVVHADAFWFAWSSVEPMTDVWAG